MEQRRKIEKAKRYKRRAESIFTLFVFAFLRSSVPPFLLFNMGWLIFLWSRMAKPQINCQSFFFFDLVDDFNAKAITLLHGIDDFLIIG